jgi:preprotein translocase subunit YajC
MGIAYAQQGGAPAGAELKGLIGTLVTPMAILLVFYLLMIRPQKKKEQALKNMLENLKTGDQIVTSGGIYGTIVRFGEDNRVKIKIAENVTVEIARSAVTGKPAETTEGTKSKSD